jgi:hypothetical protein
MKRREFIEALELVFAGGVYIPPEIRARDQSLLGNPMRNSPPIGQVSHPPISA